MNVFPTSCSRLVVSGLAGGSGKTFVTLGLIRAMTRRGLLVQACKKGPDYIDTAWLCGAAKALACNLDPYFLSDLQICALVQEYVQTHHPDALVIEGNRGLYDGKDAKGTCSTAHLARLLKAPVLVVLPCTKATRTMAAVVHGLATFEPCGLAGVVLNQVGSERHGRLVKESIEQYTDVPVLGIIPRFSENFVPERQMGLFAPHDVDADTIFEKLADLIEQYMDVPRIVDIAKTAPALDIVNPLRPEPVILNTPPVIGVVRDSVLWFYYEENLEALRRAGAKLLELDLFDSQAWPSLDGLYLGGGFPENEPAQLADAPHLDTIRKLSDEGLPIYAEDGGFLLLCHSLAVNERDYPMSGIFPVRVECCPKPQGLGYVNVTVCKDTPFFREGTTFRGHEFHYTKCTPLEPLEKEAFVFELEHGVGMGRDPLTTLGFDGLLYNNTFGAYTHLYAPAVPSWAASFVAACQSKQEQDK